MSDNQFYVYAYLREDGTPYYIGKGKNRRAWDNNHSVNLPEDKNRIVILENNLDQDTALSTEKTLIKKYGRKDLGTGILRNKTDGGDGVVNPSLEWRENVRQRMLGDKNPSRQEGAAERKSIEQRRPEVVAAKREKMSGENAPLYGKFGIEHPKYGVKETEESRKKKSDSASGKSKSSEHKANIGKSHKGKPKPKSGWGNTNTRGRVWFNDGKKSFMLHEDDVRTITLQRGRIR